MSSEVEATWIDQHDVVHYVGTHISEGKGRTILTDCGQVIGQTATTRGWYPGNTELHASCIYCLGKALFGQIAATRYP